MAPVGRGQKQSDILPGPGLDDAGLRLDRLVDDLVPRGRSALLDADECVADVLVRVLRRVELHQHQVDRRTAFLAEPLPDALAFVAVQGQGQPDVVVDDVGHDDTPSSSVQPRAGCSIGLDFAR